MANLADFSEIQDRVLLLAGLKEDDRTTIKDFINEAAEEWHDRHDWEWTQAEGFVQTQAPYATGTIAVSGDTATLTGGTWPTDAAGMKLALGYGKPWYTVSTRDSGTQVTLDRSWVGTEPSGDSYVLFNDIVDLPSDFHSFRTRGLTLHDDNGQVIGDVGIQEFASWQHRAATGKPEHVALYTDKSDGTKRIILGYQIPDAIYALRLFYKKVYAVMSADGDTPFGIPRRWRSALVHGAMARIYEMPERADTNLSERYMARFERALASAWQRGKARGHRVTHLRPMDHGFDVGHRYVNVSDD